METLPKLPGPCRLAMLQPSHHLASLLPYVCVLLLEAEFPVPGRYYTYKGPIYAFQGTNEIVFPWNSVTVRMHWCGSQKTQGCLVLCPHSPRGSHQHLGSLFSQPTAEAGKACRSTQRMAQAHSPVSTLRTEVTQRVCPALWVREQNPACLSHPSFHF